MFREEKQTFLQDLINEHVNYDEKQYMSDKQQFWTKRVNEKVVKFISRNAEKLTFS